ncbi:MULTISPECIES: phage tail protein [unclassified Bradyrhizobium]|uniref:phage tail protein n=1 Tax=unclassified Bradyrhizobium TaxID=2631580 RepID=UPI002915F156|nr:MULTISPECIES: phage tail protein [unclassified Bradyrhizobium]
MPLETATYVSDLVLNNPAGSDPLAKSADHIRLIKAVLKATFGPLTGPLVNAGGQLIVSDGTASAPSHSFASNTQVGFYLTTYGAIGVAGRMTGQGPVPIGALIDFAGTTAPAGFMACNGQAVSRTTYAELYAAIGTTWGAGDGSTTFNLPDLRDRYRRHAGGSRGGAVGTLQDPDVLPHTHAVSGTTDNENQAHTHGFSGTTGGMNQNATHAHSETGFSPGSSGGGVGGGGAFGYATSTTTGAANIDHNHSFSGTTGGENQNHQHHFSTTSGSFGTSETRPYSASVLTCIRVL